MERMIYRFLLLLGVTSLFLSCTTTEFQSWEGRNSVVEGRGGTREIVDGMDVWTSEIRRAGFRSSASYKTIVQVA
jgi:hypothetical protein